MKNDVFMIKLNVFAAGIGKKRDFPIDELGRNRVDDIKNELKSRKPYKLDVINLVKTSET